MEYYDIDKLLIQYYMMKQGDISCPDKLKEKKWKDFVRLSASKRLVLYGAGHMCEYFLRRYGAKFGAKYVVDRNASNDDIRYIYDKRIFPPDKLASEKDIIVLITTMNSIDVIYENLKQKYECECFSLAQFEYTKIENRIGRMILKFSKSRREKIERYIYRNNMERVEFRRLYKRTDDLRKLLGERYLYLLHMDRMINALIDKSDDQELKYEQIEYYFKHKYNNAYSPSINNPLTFNEKNIAMQLQEADNPLFARVTDKYEMKRYVKEVMNSDSLTLETYGLWETAQDVDLNDLPSSFVIKATNGGDGSRVVIVKNKDKFDGTDLQKTMSDWVGKYKSLYYSAYNGVFKNVRGRIIAEEYLKPEDDTDRVLDYKFWMFNGKLGLFYISEEIFDEDGKHVETKVSYFKPDKKPYHNVKSKVYSEVVNLKIDDRYDEMLNISLKLSEGFEFIRVDFFVTRSRYVVAELTLTPSGGMLPFDDVCVDKQIGELWVRKDES